MICLLGTKLAIITMFFGLRGLQETLQIIFLRKLPYPYSLTISRPYSLQC